MVLNVGLDTSALDPQFKGHAQRGIGRYVSELQNYFVSQNSSSSVKVGSFDQSTLRASTFASKCIDALPAGRRTLSQQLLYPLRLNRGSFSRYDLVHFPAHMDAPAWSPKKYVLTVLDLIPLVFQDMYRADNPSWRFHFARFLEIRAIRSASLILAISHNTARDVHRILGIPEERIVVTHLGVDQKFFDARLIEPETVVRSKFGLPQTRPIVLYVGGIDQRKNFKGLIGGFRELLERAREARQIEPMLVMAGGISKDRQYPKLIDCIKRSALSEYVFLPGFVSDRDLLQLYAMSSVFFFPSLYEGFGFPPLEAMAAGVPVLSSGASSMPEVLGTAAVIYDPGNEAQAGQELYSIIYDPQRAAILRQEGPRQARKFSWEKTGEETMRAYESLASAA